MVKPVPAAPVTRSRARKIVVTAAPTSTTKMTGFFARVTGFNLTRQSLSARRRISGSKSGRADVSFLEVGDIGLGEELAGVHEEVLNDRAERQSREVGQ